VASCSATTGDARTYTENARAHARDTSGGSNGRPRGSGGTWGPRQEMPLKEKINLI
jgi:hypothetical protein